jgi:signal transduction histidine kinase
LKLEQVFANLFANSVKYINAVNGNITVNCEEFKEHYRFSVKDNGIGIDPQYHNKIFELFQTLRERDEKESTGMGLAIIKKIIDEAGGSIVVKSTLGEGAEFIFTWPRQIDVAT